MTDTMPTTPVPAHVQIVSFEPSLLSDAHNLRRITRTRGAHRWKITYTFPPLKRAVMQPLLAMLMKQRGRGKTFFIQPPVMETPLGAGGSAGTVTAVGSIAAGVEAVPTTGWTPVTMILKAGDWVQFNNHPKAYCVTADVTSAGGGTASIPIRPQLQEPVSNGVVVRLSAVSFLVALDSDEIEYGYVPGPIVEPMTLTFIEMPVAGVLLPDTGAATYLLAVDSAHNHKKVNVAGDRLKAGVAP